MKNRLLYALISTFVVTCVSAGASVIALKWVPKEHREAVERGLIAPGQALYAKLEDQKGFRKLKKKGEKTLEAGKEKFEEAAEDLSDRLPHAYNIGAWAVTGFILCLMMTLFFGVSSFKAAVALGLKVTLTLVFLQAALVLGGVLAYQKAVQ